MFTPSPVKGGLAWAASPRMVSLDCVSQRWSGMARMPQKQSLFSYTTASSCKATNASFGAASHPTAFVTFDLKLVRFEQVSRPPMGRVSRLETDESLEPSS